MSSSDEEGHETDEQQEEQEEITEEVNIIIQNENSFG